MGGRAENDSRSYTHHDTFSRKFTNTTKGNAILAAAAAVSAFLGRDWKFHFSPILAQFSGPGNGGSRSLILTCVVDVKFIDDSFVAAAENDA